MQHDFLPIRRVMNDLLGSVVYVYGTECHTCPAVNCCLMSDYQNFRLTMRNGDSYHPETL